jgi:KaiC/GvpD/RAD55 family RecA-like ATPase
LAADTNERGLKIPILSDILERDVPRQSFLVGLFEPAADWLAFTLTQASGVLLQGNLVVNFVTTSTPPSRVKEMLQRFTPNLKEANRLQRFFITDMYTWITGQKSEEAESVDSLSIGKMLTRSTVQFAARSDFVVNDNASALLRYNDERTFMHWFDKLIAGLRQLNGVRLYGFTKRFHSEALYAYLESLADGVIELDYRENGGVLEHFVRVKSMKGMPHASDWRRLTTNPDGSMQLSK